MLRKRRPGLKAKVELQKETGVTKIKKRKHLFGPKYCVFCESQEKMGTVVVLWHKNAYIKCLAVVAAGVPCCNECHNILEDAQDTAPIHFHRCCDILFHTKNSLFQADNSVTPP